MELNIGHKLQNGKYRIEKKIGQGGFGITYLARCYEKIQSAMGSTSGFYTIVIKEFFWSRYCSRDADGHSVSISSTEGIMLMSQFKKKLKKEGEIISRLSHPNIVGILDIFEENNTAYLVMQYVEGESLGDIIRKKGKIGETTALQYTEQICSALDKIHSKRILHLDIKPSNILIDEDNHVKLIDFGISKQYDETEQETSNTPIGVSSGYSPIEQYGALKSFLPPTDIYAAGATLYKMLTGQTPLPATARSESDLEPVRNFSPNVSKKTAEAVAKAMSEKVRDRFQTAQDFLQALKSTKSDGYEDEETYIDTPPASMMETIPDDKKTGKQPEIIVKPKPSVPQRKPDIPKQPVNQFKKDNKPEKPSIIISDKSVYRAGKNNKKGKSTIIGLRSFERWKKYLPAAAIFVIFAVIVFVFITRSTRTGTRDNATKNMSTNIIEEVKTNVSSQTPPATQPPVTQTPPAAQPPVTQTDTERLQKERQEREAERLRQEREAQAKQEAERQRKEKEEQDRREAESLRLAREAQAKVEAERQRKEKEEQDRREAANFLQQANSTFRNSSLGTARLDRSFQLYMQAKEKGADVTEGYRNFMSVAQTLIGGGTGFDSNVKKLLEYAQKLNNTKEVRDLLEKYQQVYDEEQNRPIR